MGECIIGVAIKIVKYNMKSTTKENNAMGIWGGK